MRSETRRLAVSVAAGAVLALTLVACRTSINQLLAEPGRYAGQEVTVGASLGLAVGKAGFTYAGDLLKEAEIALHRAKVDPVRKFVMFDPEMRAETLDRATLEHDLRGAIALRALDPAHAAHATAAVAVPSPLPLAADVALADLHLGYVVSGRMFHNRSAVPSDLPQPPAHAHEAQL